MTNNTSTNNTSEIRNNELKTAIGNTLTDEARAQVLAALEGDAVSFDAFLETLLLCDAHDIILG